jgi:NitT/TauT family transport system permease protein
VTLAWCIVLAGVLTLFVALRLPSAVGRWVRPLAVAAILLALWHIACVGLRSEIFPTPGKTWEGMQKLVSDGVVFRYAIASVFRVAAGFLLAAVVGIPLGLWAGWSTRAFEAINPLIQGLRPISPIAWLPVAILWFGIGDEAAIFIIFLTTFFTLVTGTMTAVRSIPEVYIRSARNFGVSGLELFRRVVLPAALPQIITSIRIALGIGWIVVVAAEMLGVNSGLGYLVMDARNMGMRYDLVVGAMICIGLIGILLDVAVRRLERMDEVRWGFSKV